ncbi:MAG: hypothetical protein COB41_00500 [Proteobacteria bacterium]|nr:MAG: hypothetical protein COB41_00500 [Pseudomonadota bacterium]
MKKLTKKQNLFPWLRHKLRRLSYMWPERKDTKIAARVSRGKYECAHCLIESIETLWGPKDISLDHVKPVVPVTIDKDSKYIHSLLSGDKEVLEILNCKEEDLQDIIRTIIFVSRLFCKAEGFQVLCHEHHDIKTFLENELRKNEKKT